ncbi:hypothetical protein [Chondromyces apiculatus]|uniref:Secreted protein n=1 Tax=Chondromyces apiculatus DSM 436 TaxID=1192034 RepID=A0A017T9L5_9BACT|nr:hypothetical protein [Chondromyces apiculatus]EYF05963.1 Hypothetical protein CAP_2422 [Chondromyces apiculatus DSM 436]
MSLRSSKPASFVSCLRYGAPALLAAGALAVATYTAAPPAHASETCKSVKIKVINHVKNASGNYRDIKVLRAIYLDGGTWRTEQLANKILTANGGTWTWVENLGNVRDENTQIKIVFQVDTGGSTWSSEETSNTGTASAVCSDGSTYTKDLVGTY